MLKKLIPKLAANFWSCRTLATDMGSIARGSLIVLEGGDRCGKTTQCKLLAKALNAEGIVTEQLSFPARHTEIGKIINLYLEKKCNLSDHAVHLLFSANRWEMVDKITETLNSGTTLVIDRYAYSGVAFTAAKSGMDLQWCRHPDVGLPCPDLVVFLNVSADCAASRGGFGDERYESTDFQKKVASIYAGFKEKCWKDVDASITIDEIHTTILEFALDTVKSSKNKPIEKLWA